MESVEIKKMGFIKSFAIYILAALLMYVMTHFMIPYLVAVTGQEPILFWFITAGLGVFTPLIITALLVLKSEGYSLTSQTWKERLRFQKMTRSDWYWVFVGFLMIGAGITMAMKLLEASIGAFNHSPSFMTFEPLSTGRYWLLWVWLPYWILNIMGEEFLWRGVMFPRQELVFGKYTWIVHGLGWATFHIAFGWKLLITMLPLIFIQSFIVQKTKNSWTGVILHGGLNGPSFIAICFGWV